MIRPIGGGAASRIVMDNRHVYVPKSVIALVVLLLMAVTVIGGSVLFRHKSPAGLTEVKQSTITNLSPVAKSVGVPQSANPEDKSVTVLFYYDGYSGSEEALHYVGLMQAALKTVEPFASADTVKVRTFTNSSSKCHIEKKVKSLLVCDKSLIGDINKLNIPHFKLVIVSPLNFVPNAKVSRGKNSALYVSTYKGALTQTELDQFVSRFSMHELGHAFGLRDEYVRQRPQSAIGDEASATALSSNIAFQPAQPNCAPDEATARKWWKPYLDAKVDGVALNAGCAGRDSYYFPQKNSLMSDDPQMEAYGLVSEDYIRGALDCFYGGKDVLAYPSSHPVLTGQGTSCQVFRALFPNFWTE